MRLPNVTFPGQPQLEAVLNRMIAAINTNATGNAVAGRGIAITDSAGHQVIEATPEAVWQTRGLYPRMLKNASAAAVGLTPGFVTFLRDNTTSVSVVPYIGTDFATGTLIDDDAPPSIILTDGTYYTRLKLEDAQTVKVDFVAASASAATDANYLIVNKFTLTTITGGDQVISDVEVYSQEPLIAKRPTDLLWTITDTSVAGETPEARVTVADGLLLVSEFQPISTDGASWSGMRVLKKVPVTGDEFTAVATGEHIWLKIEFDTTAYYDYHAQLVDIGGDPIDTYNTNSATAGGDDHTHAITLKAGGANELSAEIFATAKQYSGHSFLVSSSDQTDTDNAVYIKLATITVASDAVTKIAQYIMGCPITVPLVSITYADGSLD